MGLLLQLHHRVEVLVVDVGVNPEQTLQDRLGNGHEVLGEGDSCRESSVMGRGDTTQGGAGGTLGRLGSIAHCQSGS